MDTLRDQIDAALKAGHIMGNTASNLLDYLAIDLPEWALLSIKELVKKEQWTELNDRFFKTIEFGTAGMRGRVVGHYVTQAEKDAEIKYKHAAIGSFCMNDLNVIRATIGLFKYCQEYIEELEFPRRPSLVIAHDMRYFSQHFCELAASTWSQLGGDVYVFDGPRSTPQLSFSIRYLETHAGIMITASHNPFYDNGYKVYFEDGAQISDTHAKGIIRTIEQVSLADTLPFLAKNLEKVFLLAPINDEAYLECIQEVLIDHDMFRSQKPRVVFTPLHGTGSVSLLPLLKVFEWDLHCVPEQLEMNPDFPTVKFPNPEHKEAIQSALELAKEIDADGLIATDPDGDRMGAAIKDERGDWHILNGNTIAALLAEYRIIRMLAEGAIPNGREKRSHIAIIKSYVTTPLLKSMADYHHFKIVETLTGFKWIGAKLKDYEEELKLKLERGEGLGLDYNHTRFAKRRELLMQHSTFFIFGGEESYGYLANDRIRDKDANATALMFCELLAYFKAGKSNFNDFLDEIYCKYGYFKEDLLSFSFEGAAGFDSIQKLMAFYRQNTPKKLNNVRVLNVVDFLKPGQKDCDGKPIPTTNFLIIKLIDGFSVAIRPSGTEPKVKMYLFGQSEVEHEDILRSVKKDVDARLQSLKEFIRQDVEARLKK